MSRQRVVKGTDARGRPKTAWADPEADTSRAYGHMEPAIVSTIERRQATPEELAAARAREAQPSHLTVAGGGLAKPATGPHTTTQAHMQASRQRGAERHVEVVAARKTAPALEPPAEEEIVSHEPAHIVSSESPPEATEPGASNGAHFITDPMTEPVLGADVALDHLAVAAEGARIAWDAKATADIAWEAARATLALAYLEVEWLVEREPVELATGRPAAERFLAGLTATDGLVEEDAQARAARLIGERAAAADETLVASGGGPAPRRNVHEPRTAGLTARQQTAISLMQTGKTRAEIARSMGTTYQTVDGLFEAAARKKLLPIDLIPLLPARFAKYTGV